MKTQTREFLLNFIKTHYLNDDYTLQNLFFGIYSEDEFKDIDELLNGINEFFDFFINHIQDIKFDTATINKNDLINEIESSRENIKHTYNNRIIKNQAQFSDSITNSLKNPSEMSLLDVGTGYSSISSLLFAKRFKKVTAIDSHFMLSTLALKNMNVKVINSYFDNDTDLSDFDIVVGRAPCSAIEPIVDNCSNHNKPYIIMLCDCDLKPQLKKNTDSLGWENVLPQLDPNIKFLNGYAYNVQNLDFNDTLLKRFVSKIPKYKMINQSKSSQKVIKDPQTSENYQDFYMDYFK